ncbi:hypothetical protein E2C16_04835 [Sporosarcina pasteurii]|nr:hypothetical protein E2C16_04835 [Sporosarcina pasteurii]
MIGAEGGDSCGISVTGETPQWSDSDRGGSPHAPRKASAYSGNHFQVLHLLKQTKHRDHD